MKYPIIYRDTEIMFDNLGLYIAKDAFDLSINQILNGEFTINFEIPVDEYVNSMLSEFYFVKCNDKIFFITKIELSKDKNGGVSAKIQGENIRFLLRNSYVFNESYYAKTVTEIISDIFAKNPLTTTRFKVANWVNYNDKYDITFNNANVYECFTQLAELFGGEIDCDNMPDIDGKFAIGIRKPNYSGIYEYEGGGIGGFKYDIQIREGKNVVNIQKEIDYTNQVSRMYITGKSGISINNHSVSIQRDGITPQIPPIVIGSQTYLQVSPLPANVKVGYVTFPDIDDKTELYWAAKSKFDEISKPKINYDIEVVDLSGLPGYSFAGYEQLSVGDVVWFYDKDLVENNEQRIRVYEYEYYPFEPEKNRVKFSSTQSNMFYTFADFYNTTVTVDNFVDNTGKIIPDNIKDVEITAKRVINDGTNAPYSGHIITEERKSGVKISKKTTQPAAKVFLEDDGKTYMMNESDVGIYIPNGQSAKPKIRTYDTNTNQYVLTDIGSGGGGGADSLNDLTDVTITNPQNGSFLVYDSSINQWRNSLVNINYTNWPPDYTQFPIISWGLNVAGQTAVPVDLGAVSMFDATSRNSIAINSQSKIKAWGDVFNSLKYQDRNGNRNFYYDLTNIKDTDIETARISHNHSYIIYNDSVGQLIYPTNFSGTLSYDTTSSAGYIGQYGLLTNPNTGETLTDISKIIITPVTNSGADNIFVLRNNGTLIRFEASTYYLSATLTYTTAINFIDLYTNCIDAYKIKAFGGVSTSIDKILFLYSNQTVASDLPSGTTYVHPELIQQTTSNVKKISGINTSNHYFYGVIKNDNSAHFYLSTGANNGKYIVSNNFSDNIKDIAIGHDLNYPNSILAVGVKFDGSLIYEIPTPLTLIGSNFNPIPNDSYLVPPSFALTGIDSVSSSGSHFLAKKLL